MQRWNVNVTSRAILGESHARHTTWEDVHVCARRDLDGIASFTGCTEETNDE